ncbi:MAG: TonB family protein, partial [Bacteroides sp.]|nr:TonB family protein [Bacteroides sp.]
SWDLLVADICIFFQWFNPASWLLKQELQNIHEFEADETVIKEGVNAKQYQLLLIKKAVGTRLYSMANSFNHSKLKKRITMMMKEKSSPWARLKYLYVLPVAAVAVTAFARPEVSDKVEEISAVKVNDLAAIVETKVAESVGDTLKPANVKYVPTEVGEELKGTPVFEVVEEMPEFPDGGVSGLMDYFRKNMRYPEAAKKKGMQGRVTMQFVVDKDGSIRNAKILRAVDEALDAEALRLINSMPKWKPGRQKGEPVAVKYTVPVMFKLDGEDAESSSIGKKLLRISGEDEPLCIVDGKEVTPKIMEALKSDRIEGITVLKDKQAVELYGDKAKNGVILITLKKEGSPSVAGAPMKEGEVSEKEGLRVTVVGTLMKVEGKVVDEQGEPVVGASILLEGTKKGTVTDVDGNFRLSVPANDAVLVVSYIGMATAKVKAQPKLTVALKGE